MHELGLCDAFVDAIVRRAQGRQVTWARVRVGGHPVDPAVIVQGMELAAAGTEAEGARFEIVSDPQRARCRGCGAETTMDHGVSLVACPRCRGLDIELVGSQESVLEALAYRQPVDADNGRTVDNPTPTGNHEEDRWMPSSS